MSRESERFEHHERPLDRVPGLIASLASNDGLERVSARLQLIRMGEFAVPWLTEALRSPHGQVRWEAAKALIDLPSARSIPALIAALEDQDADVRWLAAEALVARQRDAAIAVLAALREHSDSVWVREGAHHVLRALATDSHGDGPDSLQPVLHPVLRSLETSPPDWAADIPVRAAEALEMLRHPWPSQEGRGRAHA
ncbi:MAG: HEAT repeat domain-containing protein [Candidatus Eiseniibacteriota bacterium]